VGVTQYLGHKSGSTFIYIFSFVTIWVFGGYYVLTLALRLAALVKLFGWRKPRLALTGAILVYMIVAVTVLHYVHIAVDELAAAQAR
jgi:hypothetical protein